MGLITSQWAIPRLQCYSELELSYTLEVNQGDCAFVRFGAQSQDVVETLAPKMMAVQAEPLPVGIFLCLAVTRRGWAGDHAWRTGKPDSKLSGRRDLEK